MCSQSEVNMIIGQLNESIGKLFPHEQPDVILFGSYARNEQEDDSDIDVLYLVNASRQQIAEKNWQVGEAASKLLLEHNIVVSPIIENRDYFHQHTYLPFFNSILREGVRVGD